MRLLAPSIAVLAGLTLSAGVVHASDADFTLVNRTGAQIDEIHVTRTSEDSWGKDILGQDTLDDGESVDITFPHGGSACMYDIKVVYHSDKMEDAVWNRVDLCKYEKISIYIDKSGNTRAVGE